MFDGLHFEYNGVKSIDMGVYIVRVNNTDRKYQFGINRTLKKDFNKNHKRAFVYGTEENPLTFELELSTIDAPFTLEKRKQIIQWLYGSTNYLPPQYAWMQSCDDPGVGVYCMPTEAADKILYGTTGAVMRIPFECNAPYGFTNETIDNNFKELETNTSTQTIILTNDSNIERYYYPILEFTMLEDATQVSFKNLTDGNRTLSFTNVSGFDNLKSGETICIDNYTREIESSLGLYRLNNCNKIWLRLMQGQNRIEVTGKIKLVTKMQFPVSF